MSGSTPCPMCGTLSGPGDEACGTCGLSLREVRESNAGGAKCARCGSAMPSGFDFCPVCGQDQRERWRRPPTQSLRIHPAPRSQDLSPGPGGASPSLTVPATGANPAPAHPAMHTPFGALVEAPPQTGGAPAPAAPAPLRNAGPDRTVPTPHYGSSTPAGSIDRTVPSPSMGSAPSPLPGGGPEPSAMPPVVSNAVDDDDATVPAVGVRAKSFEEAAFGPSRGNEAEALEDSKTIPFITLQQRQQQQGGQGPGDGPSMTIPAIFVSNPPVAKPVDANTRPDRPGGFSGGPTGEAPPTGVNVARRSRPPIDGEPVPSRLPTYPGNAPARLVLVARDGTEGESFPFHGETITVGRTHGDILFPEDPFLSPVHVRLNRTGTGILLTDTGSTNGVYLRIANNAPVYPGDMFMIGHQLLRLDQLDSQAQEHPPGVDGTRLFGTPLQPAWGRVTQLGRGGVAGDHMYLRGSRVSFGREGGDLVFPNDPFVSREHARLRLEITGQAMAVFLEDLGSANGTYVRIRGAAEIATGDTFRVGDQILKLRLD